MNRPSMRPFAPLGRTSAMLMSLVLFAACGAVDPSNWASSSTAPAIDPTAVPNPAATAGPTEASDTQDGFRLVLTLPATTVPASEPVTGEAVLSAIDGQEAGIAGSGGGVIAFSYTEIGGTRAMSGVMTSDCALHTIPAGDGLHSSLRPSGGWSADDPNAEFYQAFTQGPDVRLPAGAWRITAHAVFMGPGCSQPEHNLEASVVVVVTP